MNHRRGWYLLGSGILLLALAAGCGMPDFESIWRDRAVTIDGRDGGAEWENARYYFEDQKVTIGLMNDEDLLYIRLSTRDRSIQRQLMALGFTLWFDETGNKGKKLGIHFPLGIQGRQTAMGSSRFSQGADSTQVNTILDAVQTEMELIGPEAGERDKYTVVEAQRFNVLCKVGLAEGNLVYELQFPLHRTGACPYGILSKPGKSLKIGFATTKMDLSRMRARSDGGSMGRSRGGMGGDMTGGRGGMGGMGGGMGGRGGRTQGMSRFMPEPLELWITVNLTEKPAGAVSAVPAVRPVVSAADSAGTRN